MTEAEALERCDMLINSYSINNGIYDAFKDNEKGYPTFNKMREFAEMSKEAMEKQIPKKIVINNIPKTSWTKATTKYTCPSCDRVIGFNGMNYCPTCGQRLNWSEV